MATPSKEADRHTARPSICLWLWLCVCVRQFGDFTLLPENNILHIPQRALGKNNKPKFPD